MKPRLYIEQGRGYHGPGGEVRHTIIISNVGRGQRIFWDSISGRNPDYYGERWTEMKNRPHGMMAMRDFQKWAIGPLTA